MTKPTGNQATSIITITKNDLEAKGLGGRSYTVIILHYVVLITILFDVYILETSWHARSFFEAFWRFLGVFGGRSVSSDKIPPLGDVRARFGQNRGEKTRKRFG